MSHVFIVLSSSELIHLITTYFHLSLGCILLIMSSSSNNTNKRTRKHNWSDEEVFRLLDYVEQNYDKLFGKLSSHLTYKEKRSMWEDIANKFNDRNAEECKHKFQKLKSEKIIEYHGYLKRVKATGGGPAPKPLSELTEKVIAIIGTSNPKICGLEGGIDTALPETESPSSVRSSSSSFDKCEAPPQKLIKVDKKSTTTSLSQRPNLIEDQVRNNLQQQHELAIEKLKKETDLIDLQMNIAKLQLENEQKRKMLLDSELSRLDCDRYAFLN